MSLVLNDMNMEVFKSPQFGEIRVTMDESGEPWFCAKDVAGALKYADTADAISRHCKSGKKVFHPHANGIGGVNIIYIPEKDLYRLIMRSNLPDAEKFQDWICEDVLPSIRKFGIYATPTAVDQILNNPDFLIELLQKYKEAKANEEKLALEVKQVKEEVKLCDRIITHLTERVDINDMRQTINDILRKAKSDSFGTAWRLLYQEFQKKYHINIQARKNFRQYSNLLDYIDKELNMIPELYELACALFTSEYEEVKRRWEKGVKSGNINLLRTII